MEGASVRSKIQGANGGSAIKHTKMESVIVSMRHHLASPSNQANHNRNRVQ